MARYVIIQKGQLATLGVFPSASSALKWARDRMKQRSTLAYPFWNGQVTIAQLKTVGRHNR